MKFEFSSNTTGDDSEQGYSFTVNGREINPYEEPVKAIAAIGIFVITGTLFLLLFSTIFISLMSAVFVLLGYILVLMAAVTCVSVLLGIAKYLITGSAEPFVTLELGNEDDEDDSDGASK